MAKEGPRARPFESREPLHPHFLTRRGGALRGVFPARWPSADEELFTMATRVKRIMTQPINLIFRFLQNKTRVQIWLYENTELRIEGKIIGFDEYMNLVVRVASLSSAVLAAAD